MAVFQVKKYKTIKDENGNKIRVEKTKEEWNKETKNGTATWYFSDRYEINNEIKQYKSGVFALKREAEAEERLFLDDPIKYILEHSKRAKKSLKSNKINSKDKTLNEYFEDFNQYKIYYIKGSSVYEDKKNWNNHISPFFGDMTPDNISFEKVQTWFENANAEINPRTNEIYSTKSKNKWYSTLSEFFQFLKSKGKISLNYAKAIGRFKNPKENKNTKKKIKYQTEEQFNLFMSIINDEFWYIFFNFTFWHGCRIGEQRALKIQDIDFENDIIHFHKTFTKNENGKEEEGPIKNGKERFTYLDEHSKPYLQKIVNMYKNIDGYNEEWYLFGGPYNTYKNRIERKFKEYYTILKNKYPNKEIITLTHHEFGRHSRASYMLDIGIKKGINREEIYSIIAQQLGDTVDVIKRVYAHPYEDENIQKTKNLLKF